MIFIFFEDDVARPASSIIAERPFFSARQVVFSPPPRFGTTSVFFPCVLMMMRFEFVLLLLWPTFYRCVPPPPSELVYLLSKECIPFLKDRAKVPLSLRGIPDFSPFSSTNSPLGGSDAPPFSFSPSDRACFFPLGRLTFSRSLPISGTCSPLLMG